VIKNRPINGGKTFEEWLREKSTRQHPQEIQRDEQKERQLYVNSEVLCINKHLPSLKYKTLS